MTENWIRRPGGVPTQFDPLFIAAGRRTGVDPMVFKAMAMLESTPNLNPKAINVTYSKSGVPTYYRGLMQLSDPNAKYYHVTDPHKPEQNVPAGASILQSFLKANNGDLNHALEQYSGNPLTPKPDAYTRKVMENYFLLTGREPPTTIDAPNLGMKTDDLGNPDGTARPYDVPTLRPATSSPPGAVNTEEFTRPNSQPENPPGPAPASPGHLNMNNEPPGQPNFAQNQPDPLTLALLSSPAANKAGVQQAVRGPVPSPLSSGLPSSPFVQAFLTNAIFGGGSPAYPFALATGNRPGVTGGR